MTLTKRAAHKLQLLYLATSLDALCHTLQAERFSKLDDRSHHLGAIGGSIHAINKGSVDLQEVYGQGMEDG